MDINKTGNKLWLQQMMAKYNTDEAGVRAIFAEYGNQSSGAGKNITQENARELQRRSTEAKRRNREANNPGPSSSQEEQ